MVLRWRFCSDGVDGVFDFFKKRVVHCAQACSHGAQACKKRVVHGGDFEF